MPALTRRKYPERPDCWQIYYGDVCVGSIALRSGCPVDEPQWEWGCGFYPGMGPRQGRQGIGADLDTCRVAFEAAWQSILPTLSGTAFQEWRDQRDLTAWKYAMWIASMKMPTQVSSGKSKCFCGAPIDIVSAHIHALEAHGTKVPA